MYYIDKQYLYRIPTFTSVADEAVVTRTVDAISEGGVATLPST